MWPFLFRAASVFDVAVSDASRRGARRGLRVGAAVGRVSLSIKNGDPRIGRIV